VYEFEEFKPKNVWEIFGKHSGKKQSCLSIRVNKNEDCGLPADLVNVEIGVDD
jgi:hypothetical protein